MNLFDYLIDEYTLTTSELEEKWNETDNYHELFSHHFYSLIDCKDIRL